MDLEIAEIVGVMVLPDAVLFPGALLPLYIFEPRYRKMLAKALATHRIFGIGALDAGGGEHPLIGGVGLIRACVANSDGTSHLILQGLTRIRFLDWPSARPYPEARIEPLASGISDPKKAAELRVQAEDLCRQRVNEGREFPENFLTALENAEGPGEFCDLVAATLVTQFPLQQKLLEETDVVRRLEILVGYLSQPG